MLQRQNLIIRGQNNRLKQKLDNMQAKDHHLPKRDQNILEVHRNGLPATVLEFFETQIRYFSRKKKGMRWSDDEI